MPKNKNRAVIMDRDGTVFKDSHYLRDPNGIQMYPGVISALKKLKKMGWKLIIGTNQSGISRGFLDYKTLNKIHKNFLKICSQSGLKIDDIVFCPHHPSENCHCRKPNPGMLVKAAKKFNLDLKECYVIGDKESDILWGKRVGSKTILVLTGYGREHLKKVKNKADHISKTLPHAVKWILNGK